MTQTIYTALAKIQKELVAPKSQRNTFGNYNYRSCEDILEGLKKCEAFSELSIVITDEIVQVGTRYYVKATATLTNGSESVSNSAFARESEEKKGMDSSQVTGATSSYARKYALNGLFAIDDVKDADTQDNSDSGTKEKKDECPHEHKVERVVQKEGPTKGKKYIGCEDCKSFIKWVVEDSLPVRDINDDYSDFKG